MIHLQTIRLPEFDADEALRFPFSVPAIRSLSGTQLEFPTEVTFLVGENGSGKSTLLEALACAAGSITVGSESVGGDRTLANAFDLNGGMVYTGTNSFAFTGPITIINSATQGGIAQQPWFLIQAVSVYSR